MAKVFLTCFSPFNPKDMPFTPHSSSPHPPESASLFASLILDLHKSLEDNTISLKWCSGAMLLIKTMHSHFLLLFSERVSQVADPWDRVDMAEDYLKESLDLLDLCNLLKSAISGIDRQRLMADFTFQRSMCDGFPALASIREKICKVFDVQKWKDKSFSKMKTSKLPNEAGAVQSAIAAVSFLVFSSVLHPSQIKIDKVCTQSGSQNSLSGCTRRLIRCFFYRFRSAGEAGKEVLSEVEKMSNAIAYFQDQLSAEGVGMGKANAFVLLETLQSRSVGLKEGLELLKSVVDEVFDDVIQGRKKVLALISCESSSVVLDF